MAWSIGSNVTAGSVLTASRYNQDVLDNMRELAPFSTAWVSYTPTISQPSSIAKTVTYAKYVQVGKFVWVQVNLTLTAAGTGATAISVSLPVTAANASGITGDAYVLDANVNNYVGSTVGSNTTTVQFYQNAAGNTPIGVSPNFALANTDVVRFSAFYEAA